jgi:prolyl 4-hydroxylase
MSLLSLNKYRFPSKDDYKGAVIAIMRLQDTYLITPRNLTSPTLGGVPAVNFTARDCFDIGRAAYEQENWWFVKEWMLECLNKLDQEPSEDVDLALVYDHLSFAEYQLGDARSAMQHTKDLLQNEPEHERAISNLEFFEKEMSESPEKYKKVVVKRSREVHHETLQYEDICREAPPIPKENYCKLICFYYNNHNTPGLILRPIKVEVMHLKPRVWGFKDFLSESEMTRLKEIAQPKLQRATARNYKTGQFEPADYRISKSGWLSVDDDDTGVVHRINRRIEDATGLTMTTAEDLQVVNYGIGGHYEPHYDFARKDEDAFTRLGHGNRISTLLMYMSNVTLGGATVFPQSGARIAPVNGMAVYWWNLKKSGEGDMTTRHAACPVLVGTKWVCNKWIHEAGQEFRRRCSLSKNQ